MGRFVVIEAIGVGGSGRVVLVEDRLRPGPRLALKELLQASEEETAALHREFATLATLRHPSLVEVFELHVDPETGRSQFTMEHVDGANFVATVKREGPNALIPLAAETLRALAFLHDFGLVHRDIKPANILVRRQPKAGHRVVVLDFGLAVARRGDPAAVAPGMAGTMSYIAPELFDNAAPTKRSDLYAFGAVVYEAVHGKLPFAIKGNDLAGFVETVRQGRRARPTLPAGFPPGLSKWIDLLLSPDPMDRPSSAIDALARLNEACGTSEPLATSDDRAARLGSGVPVGRDDELAALRAAIAPSDSAGVVWLTGDAGSGKTRILRHLAAEAAGQGWRVHALPGVLPEAPDAFVARVRDDAGTDPTLVLLDEIEGADNAVATFLDRIAREPREAPVHVVAAVRPGELKNPRLKKLLDDTGVVPSLVRVDLAPMRDAALRAMVERATAGQSSALARVKWLTDASEGNAGAAEALLVEGVWERKARVPAVTVLERSITRRLDALSPEARSWLEALAVLGDDAPESLVGELAGLEDGADAAAAEVIAAGLARRGLARVSPDSRRVAEAAKSAASTERRLQLHALAATHYAAQDRDVFGNTAWRLARLWRGAGESQRAFSAANDAASAAEVAKDWGDAAERYRFALTLLSRRDPRRAELWMKCADALRRSTLHAAAAKAYGFAARHASNDGDRFMALARKARALFSSGRFGDAERVASQVAVADGSPSSLSLALVVITHAQLQRFEFREALSTANRAADISGEVPPEIRAEAMAVAAAAGWRLDDPQADARCAEAERIARQHGLIDVLMLVLAMRSAVEERRNELEAYEATLLESASIASTAQRPQLLYRATHQTARLHALVGRFDKAYSFAKAAEELALLNGAKSSAVISAVVCAEALLDTGRPGEAAVALEPYVVSGSDGPTEHSTRYPRAVLARALIESGSEQSVEVAHLLEGTLEQFRAMGAFAHLDGLVHELIWRTTFASKPLAPVLEEAEALLGKEGKRLPQAGAASLRLYVSLGYLAAKDPERALGVLADASPAPGAPLVPHTFGRIQFVRADALEALGRLDEANTCRLTGNDLIQDAASRIADADWKRNFLDQPAIRKMLAAVPKPSETRRVEALYDMIRALNSETDPEVLLESILEMGMKAVDAERGMILLSGPTGLDFSVRVVRNLEKETEADAEAFSRRIVSQAEIGESVLALDAGQDDRFKDFKSVSLFRIRSLMCVPLRSRARIIGTVYLDSRRQGKLFTQDDLRFVEAFADHAALALENARRRAELEQENRRLKAAIGERSSYGKILGRSPTMQKVFDLLERIASSEAPILILGESGTGKELVAKALHFNSPRKDKPFISENVAALPETLLESELFGHVKGAYTGAERDRAGLFEQAHDGTLFLDEVGDMSPAMQARLLRVLQEGELRRVGGDQPIKVNVRILAATNKELQSEVAAGRFREDLYYRLAVVPVHLPPLRERVGDVPFLARHLMDHIAAARGRSAPRIDSEVLDAMERYPWPGNVRQLENVLRRISLLAGDAAITRGVLETDAELARMLLGRQAPPGPLLSMVKTEEEQIRRALEAAAGNRDRAARLLGISRATIYRKMREYSLR